MPCAGGDRLSLTVDRERTLHDVTRIHADLLGQSHDVVVRIGMSEGVPLDEAFDVEQLATLASAASLLCEAHASLELTLSAEAQTRVHAIFSILDQIADAYRNGDPQRIQTLASMPASRSARSRTWSVTPSEPPPLSRSHALPQPSEASPVPGYYALRSQGAVLHRTHVTRHLAGEREGPFQASEGSLSIPPRNWNHQRDSTRDRKNTVKYSGTIRVR
jgi:hypothetical protein